jgi:hypothetical protein
MLVGMAVCREVIDTKLLLAAGEPAKSAFFIGLYDFSHVDKLSNGRYPYVSKSSPCSIPDGLLWA